MNPLDFISLPAWLHFGKLLRQGKPTDTRARIAKRNRAIAAKRTRKVNRRRNRGNQFN
jgi:hypothetical protein